MHESKPFLIIADANIRSYESLTIQAPSSATITPSNRAITLILTHICIISTNNYFCYHAPSAIAQSYETFYHINTEQFGSLFTIYSLPNIILVFLSGQLIDTYGLRKTSIIFNIIILFGMTIAAITPYFIVDNQFSLTVYMLLLLSRLLLGIGKVSSKYT